MAFFDCDCNEISKRYKKTSTMVTSVHQAAEQLDKCQKCYDGITGDKQVAKAYDNVRLKYVDLYWKRRVTQKDLT